MIYANLVIADGAFQRALADVQRTIAAAGARAEAAAARAQAFHDELHALAEAEWRAVFYVQPEAAWWEQ